MTTKVATSDGNIQTAINSNKSQLTVTPARGKLSLESIPSYSFDNITASDIYNGTQGEKSAKTSNLSITDTRAETNKNWSLSAKMTKMTSNLGTQFENEVQIRNLASNETSLRVTDNNINNLTLTSDKGGSLTTPVTGQLYLKANHKTQLADKEEFTSNITWTLTGAAPDKKVAE